MLHVHNLEHGHDEHLDYTHVANESRNHAHFSNHTHLSKAHYAHDRSHNSQHDGVVYEVDTSPDRVLKNVTNNIFTLAVFLLLFTLVLFSPLRQRVYHHTKNLSALSRRYVLAPPLRAPPLD
jgi:hypothetical protein